VRYQLVVLGPNANIFSKPREDRPSLETVWETRIKELGLDPSSDFEVLGVERVGSIQWKGSPVGLWYGGPDTSPSEALETLQTRGVPVLPLVEDLRAFQSLVPETLRPINGRQWDDERVPGDVLQAFRLTPETRQAFISYRRIDSKPVADGLFEALSARGYRVFLDTASVEAFKRFQDILWDRLADMDLLILLDSPNALTSRWVNDELTRVNQLGLGVLQLIWPAPHKRFKGTELSEPFDLDASHFEGGHSGPEGRLTPKALAQIVARAEEVRIRSLNARRIRVVRELIDRAGHSGFRPHLYPMGPIAFRSSDSGPAADPPLLGMALPIIGLPDAWSIHQIQKQFRKLMDFEDDADISQIEKLLRQDGVRIIYDGLGVETQRAEHLVWLNEGLPLKTTWFDRFQGEPNDPLQAWLTALGAKAERSVA
jgi:TIR domain